MRYEGKLEDIQAIEREIKRKALCFAYHKPKDYDNLFGIKSVVETKVLDVLIPNQMYIFPVRFLYDGRDNTGKLDVKDRDVWWLCKVSKETIKLIAKLSPQQDEKAELTKGKKR